MSPLRARAAARIAAGQARVMAIDPGRSSGWARCHDGAYTFGTWALSDAHTWAPHAAAWQLQQCVANAMSEYRPDAVVIERPFGASAPTVIEAAGLSMVASVAVYAHDVEPDFMAVSTIRKAVCGTGRATKRDVVAEIKRRGFAVANDHEADAVALLLAWQART
jgi:Holliday junction resolvasome RuvABC endonuclease subunit